MQRSARHLLLAVLVLWATSAAAARQERRQVLPPVQPALVVEVRFDDGSSAAGLRVRAESPEPVPFVDARGRREAPPWLPGRERDVREDPPWVRVVQAVQDGRAVFEGLRPRGALEVAILDGARRQVARRTVSPWQLDGREPIVFELPGPPKELAVLAVDGAGEPVPRFDLCALGADRPAGSTPHGGRASLRGLVGGSVDVAVQAPGLQPAIVRGVALRGRREELRVVLPRGLTLRVYAADAEGRDLPVREVVVELGDGLVVTSTTEPDGGQVLRGLPARPLPLRALVGSRWRALDHDPRAGALVLRSPPAGSVVVRWEPAPPWTLHLQEEPCFAGCPGPGCVPTRLRVRTRDPGRRTATQEHVLAEAHLHDAFRLDALEAGAHALEVVLPLRHVPGPPQVLRSAPFEVRPGEVSEVVLDTRGVRWR